nr:DNA cytosine methyltransferase [Frondihabitans sp. VKM Ac-2883]
MHELTVSLDPRTALVLTPLAHVYRDRPTYVVLEQVTPVLPVWEAYAAVMRELGYSVVTGILNAEQYGVPQTRRRAILVARRDGIDAAMPEPTHSRYYSQDPNRLDLGVEKWVSMADALGFAGFEAHKVMGKGMVERHGERPGRDAAEPAFTIRASAGGMEPGGFVLVGNQKSEGSADYHQRSALRPAQTITSGSRSWKWERRGLTDRPSPTITGGGTETGGAEPIAKLARYTTLPSWEGATHRLLPEEAAVLQSFPYDFDWAGNKGEKFLLIGNAVPPLLAKVVLSAALSGVLGTEVEQAAA